MAGGHDALSLFVGVVRQDWEGCRRNCVYHRFLLFGSMYYVVGVAFQYICFCYTRVEILEGSVIPEHWSRWRGGGGTLAFSSTSLFGQPAPGAHLVLAAPIPATKHHGLFQPGA